MVFGVFFKDVDIRACGASWVFIIDKQKVLGHAIKSLMSQTFVPTMLQVTNTSPMYGCGHCNSLETTPRTKSLKQQ